MGWIKEELGIKGAWVYREVTVVVHAELAHRSKIRKLDVFLKFGLQFGNEDGHVAIERKRVDPNDNKLNGRYVTDGVERFATGWYAKHHRRAFMLGYVLALPVDCVIAHIDAAIQCEYAAVQGGYDLDAALKKQSPHQHSLAIFENAIYRDGEDQIRLMHVFVDMSPQ